MPMTTQIYTHPSCLAHDTGPGHPESTERLKTLLELFREEPFKDIPVIEYSAAEIEWITRAHPRSQIAQIEENIPAFGLMPLDGGDTIAGPHSWDAALHAAGAVCQAIDDVVNGPCSNAFCAVRPPGHHAMPEQVMGFCLLNNIFIGARFAQEKLGLKRIAIVDFDVHHGNGTDAMTRTAEDIFYISSHQFPWYPGTGDPALDMAEKTLSIPLDSGTGSTEFRTLYERQVFPALETFKPDIILISAGFDAHKNDPLGEINLEDEDFFWITEKLMETAARHCNGRIVSALEGGYNLIDLKNSVAAHVRALSKL